MTKEEEKKNFHCGLVSIVGRPNVGKSTLLNTILDEKVSIVSKVPQTTRNQVRGIYTDERGQIVFIDTPGFHLGKDRLDQFMYQSSATTFHDVDCLIYLVDTSRRIGEEEEKISQALKSVHIPIILGLNKVDLKADHLPEYISLWEKAKGKAINEIENFTLIALSGKDKINIDKLLDIIFNYLPEGEALYPLDTICDIPQKMVMADIIREKLFNLMREEVPHSLGVAIEDIRPLQKKILNIKALIFVERNSQKEIVIGKKGEVLKRIGTQARQELEQLLETKVFLELYVKVKKDWRNDVSILQELGLSY